MINDQFSRNIGIMSVAEVQQLQQTTIAIAGCGCIGGFAAELLVRMGVGKIRLADPDVFDVSNINRQCAANHNTIGQKKVYALRDHLTAINPQAQIECFPEGVQAKLSDSFVAGSDYVIDAIDYFCFPDAVALHRSARQYGIYVSTAAALGFGTTVLTFAPDGMTIEQYAGLSNQDALEDLQGQTLPPSAYSRNLPSYATPEKVQAWLQEQTIPTISVGQALGPGLLVSQLVLHLLGRKDPVVVPDAIQLQMES